MVQQLKLNQKEQPRRLVLMLLRLILTPVQQAVALLEELTHHDRGKGKIQQTVVR